LARIRLEQRAEFVVVTKLVQQRIDNGFR
jgi:hypothetical protein